MGHHVNSKSIRSAALWIPLLLVAVSLPALAQQQQPSCLDQTRTVFAGGSGSEGCHQYSTQQDCEMAYINGGSGVAPCYWTGSNCQGCGVDNESNGDCTNTCIPPRTCANDPGRGSFAGFDTGEEDGCSEFNGEQIQCLKSFVQGSDVIEACAYDSGTCFACNPGNESNGECVNSCLPALVCQGQPSRTIFAGGPNSGACHQFDTDPSSCSQAFHREQNGDIASCFVAYDCVPCGADNRNLDTFSVGSAAYCINSCVPAPTCLDGSRTEFVGGPFTQSCHVHDDNQTACEQAFAMSSDGVVSCYYDNGSCSGCGPQNGGHGCTNTCVPPPTCPNDSNRTIFAGNPNSRACRQFDGDPNNCAAAFALSDTGITSCYYSGGDCLGCGPQSEGYSCQNDCAPPPPCTEDLNRTVFADCQQFNGDPNSCATAYIRADAVGVTSCFYNSSNSSCSPCGPYNEGTNCSNECIPPVTCHNDPNRITFTGGPDSQACRQYDGNQASCEHAFARSYEGLTSCFYQSSDDTCRGCGPGNVGVACQNECESPPPCPQDATRTIFTGYSGGEGCHKFDGDAMSCAKAYNEGDAGIASCYYAGGQCRGCGPDNVNSGQCMNTCVPTPLCSNDASRTLFGCGNYDGNVSACNHAYGIDVSGGPTSCVAVQNCSGCGPNNQSSGLCTNACEMLPAARAPAMSGYGVFAAVLMLLGVGAAALRTQRRLRR